MPNAVFLEAGKIVKELDNAVSAVRSFLKRQKWAKGLLAKARALFGKCNSFTPETQVLMADGSRKPLAGVRVGDKVLATDPETGESGARTVANLIIGYGRKSLVEITVDTDGDSGSATGTVTATDGHPFWLADERVWVKAEQLRAGSVLRTSAGDSVQVTAIRGSMAVQLVYNLTVADIHTYYVQAGSAALLNHNCGEPSDDLLDWADMHMGQTNVASEVTAANGMKGYGISENRTPGSLTEEVRGAVQATGHHGGCGEIGALCDIERRGGSIWGATAESVDVMGGSEGYGPERHGTSRGMCPACRKLFGYLNGK